MASFCKFTDGAMRNMLRHNRREIAHSKNKDIDPEKSHLNYSFPLNHGEISEYAYYKSLRDRTYIYGRGSSREAKAITGCEWVVTLPKELSEAPDKQYAFFSEAYDFISNRYGPENIINNCVHYDEKGLPHLHVIFCPVTNLDHDVVQHKTSRSNHAVKLESGRYEYTNEFKHDQNGDLIPIHNYAKASDCYDTKIDCNSVMNKIELKHFHSDLQLYLDNHAVSGKVVTGSTGGVNYSVNTLKSFTAATGLHLSDVKTLHAESSILESIVDTEKTTTQLRNELSEKNEIIKSLQEELVIAQKHVTELEAKNSISHTWGQQDRSWGMKTSIEWEIND